MRFASDQMRFTAIYCPNCPVAQPGALSPNRKVVGQAIHRRCSFAERQTYAKNICRKRIVEGHSNEDSDYSLYGIIQQIFRLAQRSQ